MKTTLHFGKIDYLRNGRRDCPVEVTIELRNCGGDPIFKYDEEGVREYTGEYTPDYVELAICGSIWNRLHTNIYCGGQCLETIAEYIDDPLFLEVLDLWRRYHLNGMHAGTPDQEAAIKAWRLAGQSDDYEDICDMLKKIGLYEVPFNGISTGRRWSGELYKYGSAWIVEPLPGDVLIRVEHMITANNGDK